VNSESATLFRSAENCPDIETHTAAPSGYLAWHAWAEKMSKTHRQAKCPSCGFWAVWYEKAAS